MTEDCKRLVIPVLAARLAQRGLFNPHLMQIIWHLVVSRPAFERNPALRGQGQFRVSGPVFVILVHDCCHFSHHDCLPF